ncbi:hypothetical protein CA267_009195 [Alteromonas pelagimontana]|uniref:Beta-ketoacyl synthase N-terminal domain-containing protein n=1 Tax=Alteromonas pelagimontana TaxID=1858656 RepID=A0A6M4ME96_9ALTE|nr:hypothetical protein [Alteromonas pelagimontana]QJR80940.1 hypothetical protein CA267_009195 [Alteromonas pelagimontana]
MSSTEYRRVVITGAGVVSWLGDDWAQVKANLSKESAVRFMQDWQKYEGPGTYFASPSIILNCQSITRKRKNAAWAE